MTFAMRVDAHQHVWTTPLVEALTARDLLPYVRSRDGLTVLSCASERPYVIDVESEIPRRRADLMRGDELDLAVIALSSPAGIEALPRAEADPLIGAHLDGVAQLGSGFAAWGPVALDQPDPLDVDRRLDRGCVGISLPAQAMAGPEALEAIGPVLERVAVRGVPLFVHPGHAPGHRAAVVSLGEPLWWRALTDYVAQMHAAWLTFATLGRREHPALVVLFAMLAGGAPLLSERLMTRGGPPVNLRDPGVFYDTSSYGPAAIEAMARRVGNDQLVYGSDRPVVEPARTSHDAAHQVNAAALVAPIAIAA
jgi:hypothetical protein